ncbi:MAG TPA: thiol reductant ABC exporter subunit CydC [Ilumatobacteraceae bacterium]|nr:thiol reductant ABC exporter subunit CydC [Ilumatobacteraceae bacterium]
MIHIARRLLRLAPSARRPLVLSALLGIAAAGASVGLAATSAWLIVRASSQPPVLHLMVAIVVVRALGVGRGVLRYTERLTGHDAALRLLAGLREACVSRLATVLPGRAMPASGDLLERFVADVDSSLDLWARVVLPAAVATGVVTGSTIGASTISAAAGAVLAAGSVTTATVAISVARRHGAGGRALAASALRTRVLDTLGGAIEIRVDGATGASLAAVARCEEDVARAEVQSAMRNAALTAATTIATGLVSVLIWLCASRSIGGPQLAVLVLLPLAINEVVGLVVPGLVEAPRLIAAAGRVLELLDLPEPEVEADDLPTSVGEAKGPFGLELRAISVGWADHAPVQPPISARIAPGSHVLITGPSGSGKSTLAATLVGFIPSLGGSAALLSESERPIELDRIDGDQLRRRVGWSAQDAHVFDSTIAANLRIARPDATDEELWVALERVALADFVRSTPDGLTTLVGEHGHALSGGERQRLTVARLLLAEHGLVILDEPTEHLDEATARLLLTEALHALADRTVVVMTHRPDLLPHLPVAIDLGER